jgi:UDP-4-amino-4,6-dideoxy-N-acetyl-beta-L-altrosamine transaminase
MIPYGRQDISPADIESVIEVLKSDFLTQGPVVPLFEKAVAEHVKSAHAIATNSATSALHIACLSLGLKKGGLLWTSPITFVASANVGLYCGADVNFVDIDPATYNMDINALDEKLFNANKEGRLPDIVMPVHFAGQPCDMRSIHTLAKKYSFKVIEDASHAIGAKYLANPVGSCEYSDVTVFSFHPVKIITTGEGGIATTNCKNIAEKLALFRSHGITRSPDKMNKIEIPGWYYEQIDLGFNYRLTDIQAALGLSQINRLDSFVSHRNNLADLYDEKLQCLPIALPEQLEETRSSRHLYPIRVDENKRKTIFDHLIRNGIGVNVLYIPVHTQPFYQEMGFKEGLFPESENFYRQVICLPIYGTMKLEQQNEVIEKLKLALEDTNK